MRSLRRPIPSAGKRAQPRRPRNGRRETSQDFPMILSMTGFAAVAAELPGVSLAVELRSVNHRYLDLTLKLPDELRASEAGFRETLAGALKRGKVECRVALNRNAQGASALAVDAARIGQLAAAASEVTRAVPNAAPLTVNEILRWPGVLAEPTVPPAELAQRAGDLVRQALAELAAARAREGAKTAAVLEACCAGLEAQVKRVLPRVPAVHAAYNEKLAARLRDAGLDPNEDRLKLELALFATKVDVAEELTRLTTHIAEVRRVIGAGGSAGKRLDFLAQELHREANTLSSKSVDTEVSQAALELKILIEQMREQVQNVE
ncbi:MAG: YicC family protein [Burkholderiales bacterium]|nr:YicC family protein [Burkholderiales bacterium]